MSWLIDTNILLRLIEPDHSMHPAAFGAFESLLSLNEVICALPQNIAEFWNVCTRPIDKNGLGFTPARTDVELRNIEAIVKVIPDIPAIYPVWRDMVVAHSVSGVQVHDTRIAAAMKVHGITHLLTFNGDHFKRFQGITVVAPDEIINQPPLQSNEQTSSDQ
jgi:predicted nucleic acid-binding protein